ncbi:MAG: DMT family transporter [Chthoniobacterales bacterium]
MPVYTKNSKLSLKGDLLVFVSSMLFASYPLFLRLNPDTSTLLFLFAFQVVGAGFFAIVFLKHGLPKISPHIILLLGLLALFCILHDFTYFFSFRLTSVANAAVGHQTVSIFLLFLAPYFLKEKTNHAEWIAVVLGILGTIILFFDAHQQIDMSHSKEGIVLSIFSGLLYALLIILYRYLQNKINLPLQTINFFRYIISITLLLPFMLFFGRFHATPKTVWTLIIFGLLYAVLASSIQQVAMKWSRVLHISVIGKSEPAFAMLYALLFLKEVPHWNAIIGGAMIIGTSLWLVTCTKEID